MDILWFNYIRSLNVIVKPVSERQLYNLRRCQRNTGGVREIQARFKYGRKRLKHTELLVYLIQGVRLLGPCDLLLQVSQ